MASYDQNFIKKYISEPALGLNTFFFLIQEPPFFNQWWFNIPKSDKKGVVTYTPEKTWGDYTIYANTNNNEISLIDLNGTKVKSLSANIPKEKIAYNDQATITRIFLDTTNPKNLYAMFWGEKNTLNHYGIIKYDIDLNILWYNDLKFHHNIEFIDNNTFITYESVYRNTPHPVVPQLTPPYIEEKVTFLSTQDGSIKRSISLLDAFWGTEYQAILENLNLSPSDPNMGDGDLMHPNTITLVPKYIAQKYPKISNQSIMISMRNLDLIAFLDLETEKITWAFLGPWRGQHSTKFLENGNIIMLDNQGNAAEGGPSRILEINMDNLAIEWEYTGTKDTPFHTPYNGMIDILPNGNILISETHSGRIFEVNKDKEIVWDYYEKERVETWGTPRIPSVFNAKRLTKQQALQLIKE